LDASTADLSAFAGQTVTSIRYWTVDAVVEPGFMDDIQIWSAVMPNPTLIGRSMFKTWRFWQLY
jgi:hypothetical protein